MVRSQGTSGTGETQRGRTVTLLMLVAVGASLALALGAPLPTAVIGLILFGILHNLLEIRYVVGRFHGLLGRPFLDLLVGLVTAIVVCRLLTGVIGRPAQLAEIVLGYGVIALAARNGLQGRRRQVAWAVLSAATAVSLALPAYHFVVLTHLHNVVPLFFLWEWSRRIGSRAGRDAFRVVQLLWVLAVPAVVLLGLFDGSLTTDPGIVRSVVGDGQSVVAASAPPGEAAPLLGARLLTVFAFMQTMQYVVWVALLPRVAPDASASFEARVPWVTGPRLWAVGFLVAAVVAVLFGIDFAQGKTLYAALAAYTAYLELPVVLALLVGARSLSAPTAPAARTGAPPTTAGAGLGGSGALDSTPETAVVAVAPPTDPS